MHTACSGRLRGAKAKNPDLSQIPQSQFQSSLSCRPLLYSYKRYHSPKTKLPSFSSRYCLFIANNAILYLSCSLLPLRYRYDCREGGPPRTTRVTLLTAHWSGTDRRPDQRPPWPERLVKRLSFRVFVCTGATNHVPCFQRSPLPPPARYFNPPHWSALTPHPTRLGRAARRQHAAPGT